MLSATLLYFAATKQPFYTFAHLPLHHSSLTFYYAILLTSTILVYMLHFSTWQPQTFLLQFYPFSAIPSYTHSLHYAICYIPQPQSFHLSAITNLFTLTCCYAICYNAQFCLPETLHFPFSAYIVPDFLVLLCIYVFCALIPRLLYLLQLKKTKTKTNKQKKKKKRVFSLYFSPSSCFTSYIQVLKYPVPRNFASIACFVPELACCLVA